MAESGTAIDSAVQQAIAACDGDAVAALRSALIAVAFLEAEVEGTAAQILTDHHGSTQHITEIR